MGSDVRAHQPNPANEQSLPVADFDTPFAMQYLFTIHDASGGAWLHPGLGADLSDQPYYVVRALDGEGEPRQRFTELRA